jgi:sugar/nucleoside kinase (ribokinase family)
MTAQYDVAAIGNAIVDVIASSDDAFLAANGLVKGSMALIDAGQAEALYVKMAEAVETPGGSAGNTIAGVASLGGQAAYIGKVADDHLGGFFARGLNEMGAHFSNTPLVGGAPTARSLINVTPDGERTMCTYLGACTELTAADVDPAVIEAAHTVYLEGYLFDPPEARRAFAKAAGLAHGAGRLIAMTLSDSFVVERHREALLGFIETQVDIVFANSEEVKALYQTDDFDNAAARLGAQTRIAAVTNGAQGSIVLAGRDSHRIDAVPVDKVVDTTGAGDQYAAGFLFGLARGRSLEVCGRLGSMAAAEVISHIGPRPQVSLADLARTQGLL